jgi:hypothetical protein
MARQQSFEVGGGLKQVGKILLSPRLSLPKTPPG